MMTNMLLFAYNYVHGTITIPVLLSLNSLLIRTRYQLKERSSLMRFDRQIMKMFKWRSSVSSVTKINGRLYDSIEVKKRQKKKIMKLWSLFYFPQLLPKTYLSTPVAFPFSSRSCGILGTSAAIHRITESREILSRIMQEECCWFATQSRCSRISDDVVVSMIRWAETWMDKIK